MIITEAPRESLLERLVLSPNRPTSFMFSRKLPFEMGASFNVQTAVLRCTEELLSFCCYIDQKNPKIFRFIMDLGPRLMEQAGILGEPTPLLRPPPPPPPPPPAQMAESLQNVSLTVAGLTHFQRARKADNKS